MRILTYGLSVDKLAGIETFLINMNSFMPDDIVFDHVIEAEAGIPMEQQDTIHRAAVEQRGGKIFFVAPKRSMLPNIRDWQKLLKEQKANTDTVYFNMYSLAWMVPAVMARLHGYRVFIHAHNNNLHDCGKLQRLLHGFFRQVQKCMKIRRLTNSQLSADFFFGGSSAEMIYNAIDTKRFAFNANAREALRRELGLEDKHVYGFAGRVMYQKNPLFLMDVFSEIQKRDPAAAFLVCGEGDLMEETASRAKILGVTVQFAGSCPNVQDYYSAMDVFVLPSRFEGLGLVLIEAQCSGLPCVTSADVVPQDAKVTQLLDYISLDSGAAAWAGLCVKKLDQIPENRSAWGETVGASHFEIRNEAPRLANILCAAEEQRNP